MAEWWQDLFDEKYLTLFAEAHGPLHTAQEVEALTTLLAEHGALASPLDAYPFDAFSRRLVIVVKNAV